MNLLHMSNIESVIDTCFMITIWSEKLTQIKIEEMVMIMEEEGGIGIR